MNSTNWCACASAWLQDYNVVVWQGMKTHPTMRPGGRRKFFIHQVLQEIFQNIFFCAQHLHFSYVHKNEQNIWSWTKATYLDCISWWICHITNILSLMIFTIGFFCGVLNFIFIKCFVKKCHGYGEFKNFNFYLNILAGNLSMIFVRSQEGKFVSCPAVH